MRALLVPTALVLAAFSIVACDEAPTAVEESAADPGSLALVASDGGSGPSARGHINLMFEGELQTMSFHAREAKDGSVRGSFEVLARAEGWELGMHGVLDCLYVDGDEAAVSGYVTHGKQGFGTEGQAWVWAVRDNGEGQATDEWTDVLFAGFEPVPDLCRQFPIAELFTFGHAYSEGGNVQVKP